jgi:drug/metabolite transporter (DMT)-like permease
MGDAPTTSSRTSRGYALAVSSVLLWSWTGILVSYLLRAQAIAPMTLAFWRELIAAATLLVLLAILRPATLRVARRDLGFLLLYGGSLALLNAAWTWSTAWNGAAVSTVLVYSSPAFTAVIARVVFGERLGPTRLLALAASIAGCVLVAQANDPARWSLNGPGIVAGILSAMCFALYSTMGKLAAKRRIDPWAATLYTFAVAAAALLPLAWLTSGSGPASSLLLSTRWEAWALLLILVVPTLGGYGLYTASLAYLPVATANGIATLEPVLTATWAHLLLGESLDAAQLVGGALILGSVVYLHRAARASEAAQGDGAEASPAS